MRIIEWLQDRLRERSTQSAIAIIISLLVFFGIEIDAVSLTEMIEAILQGAAALITAIATLYEFIRKEFTDEESAVLRKK